MEYYYDDNKSDREGHSFCGCCCDLRRAVIIINMVTIVLNMLGMIVFLAGHDYLTDAVDDDPDAVEILEDSYTDQAIILGIGIGVYLLVIYGAVRFNIHLVGLGVVWHIAAYSASALLAYRAFLNFEDQYEGSENIQSPLLWLLVVGFATCFFLYPHIWYGIELFNGVMSPETYHSREEHSCCCMSSP